MKYRSTMYPQTDGETKAINHTLGNLLRSIYENKPNTWDQILPQVELADNSIVHILVGMSHLAIVYTKEPLSTSRLSQATYWREV